ncbi:MAG: UbiD family decarboxylase [Desulfobacterales bacterium]|nr:UbiD family decarboxylase [Desulfobacterales bacterium]
MAYYKDLREYIQLLEKKGLLWRIKRPIVKETELSPLVRWQYRGLPEEKRKAFLFENVIGLNGRKYDVPVLVGGMAANSEVYATGMGCALDKVHERWVEAQRKPIPPRLVNSGPVQEEIHTGKELEEEGLDEFPFPIDIPGFDGLRRTTATHFFSKDPETGAVNNGNYSGNVSARNRMTIGINRAAHIWIHLEKAKKLGKPLQVALVTGVVPAVSFVSVAKVTYGIDEMAVAGGLAGEPIEVVKCQTVDLEVPATAELVVEGVVSLEENEEQTGSFGEYCGYMAETTLRPIFNITCISHRKNPIFTTLISQMPPSESSKIRQVAYESNLLKFLKYDCNLPGVLQVVLYEASGSWHYCVIQLKKTHNSQAWQALNAIVGFESHIGKFIIAVDEDIDPRDHDAVIWAMSFRVQPHRDTRITEGRMGILDPSTAPTGSPRAELVYPFPTGGSAILIDATRKWDYPPVALPGKEFMERARQIWEELDLPPLTPKTPWHGYELGYWPEKYSEAARLNLEDRLYELGERRHKERGPFIVQ